MNTLPYTEKGITQKWLSWRLNGEIIVNCMGSDNVCLCKRGARRPQRRHGIGSSEESHLRLAGWPRSTSSLQKAEAVTQQWFKRLAVKLDYLSVIPGTHVAEEVKICSDLCVNLKMVWREKPPKGTQHRQYFPLSFIKSPRTIRLCFFYYSKTLSFEQCVVL